MLKSNVRFMKENNLLKRMIQWIGRCDASFSGGKANIRHKRRRKKSYEFVTTWRWVNVDIFHAEVDWPKSRLPFWWKTGSPEGHFLLERQLWSQNHWAHNLSGKKEQVKATKTIQAIAKARCTGQKWSYPSEHMPCQTQMMSWIIPTDWLKLQSHFR